MDIKPFNEFIKSLTEEDRDYINECEDSINIDTSDPNFMEISLDTSVLAVSGCL